MVLTILQIQGAFYYKETFIIFITMKYFWDQYVNLRQLNRNLSAQLPPQLKTYSITRQEFLRAQSYSFDKLSFQMLAMSIRIAVDILCIMANVIPYIWDHVDSLLPFIDMQNEFQRSVGYVLIDAFKIKAFDVPFSVYETFIIQKKHNCTSKTLDLFIYDLFVQSALMLIIFPPIIYGYLRFIQLGGQHFYFYLQLFVIIITFILLWLHPNFIAPLFNEFRQLNDSNLKVKIHHLSNITGIPLIKILRMNGSIRSAHSNAYLYGLGSKKRIVIYDTLLQRLNHDEIISVLSHELGHQAYNHSFKKFCLYIIQNISMFYIFSFFIKSNEIFYSFGFKEKSTFMGTALFFHLFQPLTSIFETLLLVASRKFQFQADLYACKIGYGQNLKTSLMTLFRQSTSTATPDPLYAWVKDSHPNIHERVARIDYYLNNKYK